MCTRWPLVLLPLAVACGVEGEPALSEEVPHERAVQEHSAPATGATADTIPDAPISQYIRHMFQDRDGNMWFGTTSDGAVRFDGRNLAYFTPATGFSNQWVSSIAQDVRGDLWFGTGGGVARFDGRVFTTYTIKNGLASDQVWCLLLDHNGWLWAGTEEGVSRFDGRTFSTFPIPAADLSAFPYYTYPKQINCMIEDKAGTIWFGTNGGGVYRYDGKALTNLSEKDGLCNNFVQTILEDRAGNLWFGTQFGGLCTYDGTTFTTYTRKDLKGDHVWTLYQTSDDALWIAMARTGLCRYDGESFTCYNEKDGEGVRVVQSLTEDAIGQLWVGTSNGVYRFNDGRFTPFSKEDALRGSE